MEGWVDLGSLIAARPGIEPTTAWSQVRRPNRYATNSDPSATVVQPLWRHTFFAKHWWDVLSARDICWELMRYINWHFTCLLTYSLQTGTISNSIGPLHPLHHVTGRLQLQRVVSTERLLARHRYRHRRLTDDIIARSVAHPISSSFSFSTLSLNILRQPTPRLKLACYTNPFHRELPVSSGWEFQQFVYGPPTWKANVMWCKCNVNNKFIERTGTTFLMRYSVVFSTVQTGMFLTDA